MCSRTHDTVHGKGDRELLVAKDQLINDVIYPLSVNGWLVNR